MNDRDRRSFALLVGVISFAVGLMIKARLPQLGLGIFPDFLMFIGGSMAMWMAAKLFWTANPPGWFVFLVTFGWLVILALAMNLIARGVLF